MAHIRWLREKSLERYSLYEAERQAAYRELWERVEGLNIKIRIEEVSEDDFSKHLQDLNSFILANGIYLEDEDRALANSYARAVYTFNRAVVAAESDGHEVPLGTTQDIPDTTIRGIQAVGDSQKNGTRPKNAAAKQNQDCNIRSVESDLATRVCCQTKLVALTAKRYFPTAIDQD